MSGPCSGAGAAARSLRPVFPGELVTAAPGRGSGGSDPGTTLIVALAHITFHECCTSCFDHDRQP